MPRNVITTSVALICSLAVILIIGKPVVRVPVQPEDLTGGPGPVLEANPSRCIPPIGYIPVGSVDELRALDSLEANWDNYFLCNDIDLGESDSTNWAPLRNFSGILDGDNHTIRNLRIEGIDSNQGLFSSLSGQIKNLRIERAFVSGQSSLGILAGSGRPTLENLTIEGSVQCASGMCGLVIGSFIGTARKITASGDVTGSYRADPNGPQAYNIGCLFGHITSSRVSDSSCVSMNTGITGQNNVGGISGTAIDSIIQRSSFQGKLTGFSSSGGLVGELEKSEADMESLLAESSATVFGEDPVAQMVGGTIAFPGTGSVEIRDSYQVVMLPDYVEKSLFLIHSPSGSRQVRNSYILAHRASGENGPVVLGKLCSAWPCQSVPLEVFAQMSTFTNAGWPISGIAEAGYSTWKMDPPSSPVLAWELGLYLTPIPGLTPPATLPTPQNIKPSPRPTWTPGLPTPVELSPIPKPTNPPAVQSPDPLPAERAGLYATPDPERAPGTRRPTPQLVRPSPSPTWATTLPTPVALSPIPKPTKHSSVKSSKKGKVIRKPKSR